MPSHSATVFRALNARKARYGFQASINANSLILIGEAVKRAREIDPDLLFEVDLNYGKGVAKAYTDVEAAADVIGNTCYPS
ncbi:hypothetical protein KTD31_01330 [Burkholderia multivorans]|uniref:hypothetical protein n=1 Tax=Burkholderia multivorans TaxID=87883 RepID=UPI001C213522|nr:hypothetical protein [Burkholderia multivorans]MBU9200044.1 hypothetical protein [Burkholderia multivorans]MDN8078837.1 hypothetical protein [Burkholderia multivorans]